MNAMSRMARRVPVVATAASTIAAGASLALADSAQAGTLLTPDPIAYCVTNPPFSWQTAVKR